MQRLQGRPLPHLPQACLHVWRETLLANSPRRQVLQVLRLVQPGRWRLHMPRSLPETETVTLVRALLPAAGLGALVGVFARGPEGVGWIFALLVLSAALTAIAQQTLP